MHFISISRPQFRWLSSASENDGKSPECFREYSASKGAYRGFCSTCSGPISWRSDSTPDEIEVFVGSIDEEILIGDRTQRVSSQHLAEKGAWEKTLEEEKEGPVGTMLCVPANGNFYFRNAIKSVTDVAIGGGKRFVENTAAEMQMPD